VSIQPTSPSGINPLRSDLNLRPDRAAVPDGGRMLDAGRAIANSPVPGGAPAISRAGGEVTSEAPQGVDPQLWSLLSGEERDYFARARELGPLTYGRQSSAASPTSIRGARFDVRV